jgi:general secretion pathway protein G
MRRPRGFTLIELAITVAIVALLSTMALPLVQLTVQRVKEQELKAALREIRSGLDVYKLASDQGRVQTEAGASGYPPTLEALVVGVEDARDPEAARIYFLRRVPRDPFFPDGSVTASQTWGLRSYQSPPEDPQPGDDVYDVHSLSAGTALDGSLYRDW